MNNQRGIAVGQVLLLVLGVMAFGFMVGSEVEVVSAAETCSSSNAGDTKCEKSIEYKCSGSGSIYSWEILGINSPTCSDNDLCNNGDRTSMEGANFECVDGRWSELYERNVDTTQTGVGDISNEINIPAVAKAVVDKIVVDEISKIKNKVIKNIKDSIKSDDAASSNAGAIVAAGVATGVASIGTKAAITKIVATGGTRALVTAIPSAQIGTAGAQLVGTGVPLGISTSSTATLSFFSGLKQALTQNIWTQGGASGTAASSVASGISQGLAGGIYAAAGAYATMMVFKFAGAGVRNMEMIQTVTKVVAAVGIVGLTTLGWAAGAAAVPAVGWIFLGAMAVTALVSAILYKNFSQEFFTYKLSLWQPIPKGENCQQCNVDYDEYGGCSEYQCKTYGQACDIVNPGTEDELCDWINENDMAPPLMDTLDILAPGYRYNPDSSIRLPDRGVNLQYEGNCLPAFEGVRFGIETDEPAQCKIDVNRTFNYDDMLGFMQEGSVFVYNHTFSIPNIALPSAYAINEAGFTLDEGNNYEFYMRCKDVNDNTSPYNFVVKFCVDDGPDTTPPTISTNYINGAYVRSDQVEINDLEVYTNEPADCRWDFSDREYEDMTNEMTDCSQTFGAYTFPNSYSYGCRTTLTGIKNNELNTYYIRCEDKPGLSVDSPETRMSNRESYVLNLQGTDDIVIDEIFLNKEDVLYTNEDGSFSDVIISDSTEEIQVRIDVLTSQGAGEQGDARCSYSQSGLRYEFYNNQNYDYTPSNNHYWYLTDNNYNFEIECCDLANNCDTADIEFEVESDTSAPQVARSYYEDGLMKLVTTEESSCVYSLSTCNYLVEDGLNIDTVDNLNHFVSWNEEESFYVKCKDVYGNYPDPSECSIIVRAQYEYEDTIVAE